MIYFMYGWIYLFIFKGFWGTSQKYFMEGLLILKDNGVMDRTTKYLWNKTKILEISLTTIPLNKDV